MIGFIIEDFHGKLISGELGRRTPTTRRRGGRRLRHMGGGTQDLHRAPEILEVQGILHLRGFTDARIAHHIDQGFQIGLHGTLQYPEKP